MSRTKRAIPHWYTVNPSNQELGWIGLHNYHYVYPVRCPYTNGRDRKQMSYTHSSFKGEKYAGWSEVYQGKGKAILKRRKSKHLRRFYKHIDREWEV